MASTNRKRRWESIVRMVAVFMVAVISMLFLTQCKPKEDGGQASTGIPSYQGTHSFEYKATDKDFIKDGRTEYTVIIPEDAGDLIKTAAQEFAYLFGIATGASIKTGVDTNLSHNATNKYISIGETSLWETSSLVIDRQELGADGVRILTAAYTRCTIS